MEGQPISAVAPVVEVIRQAERADTVEERFREELKVRGAAVGGHHRKRAKAKSRNRSLIARGTGSSNPSLSTGESANPRSPFEANGQPRGSHGRERALYEGAFSSPAAKMMAASEWRTGPAASRPRAFST